MRSSKSRSRSKSNRQRSLGNIVNRVFDSSGPEGKVRGTPQQIIEKYLTLARDAQLSNDRVAEQAFFQHAEHYTRLLGEAMREQAERQQNHQNQQPQYGRGDDQQPRNGDDHPSRNGDEGRDLATRDEMPQPRFDTAAGYAEQPETRQPDMRQPEPRQHEVRQREPRQPETRQPEARQPEAHPAPQPADDQPVDLSHARKRVRRQDDALPDALATDGEGEEVRVETPEEKAPARRTRAPRNANPDQRSESPAPRNRRKPAAEEGVAPAPLGGADQA